MGNFGSVPEGFSEQGQYYEKLQRNFTQGSRVGNPDPTAQDASGQSLLLAASPKGFKLAQLTNADTTSIEDKARVCRDTYQGLAGLRKLRTDVGDRTAYEPGCGWMYKKNGTNRAAFGSEGDSAANIDRGPFLGRQGQPDETQGAQFYMDLEKAERDVSADLVATYQTCASMASIPTSNQPYIGFCKTSNKVIPTVTNTDLTMNARFPDDKEFRCASSNIITPSHTSNCPTSGGISGFRNPPPSMSHTTMDTAFSIPSWARANTHTKEGFLTQNTASEGEYQRCRAIGNLNKNDNSQKACIISAATQNGLSDNGSYLNYIKNGQDSPAFSTYQQKTGTNLKNITGTIDTFINTFHSIVLNASSSDQELSTAAKDLVSQRGYYEANFNVCSWIFETSANTISLSSSNPTHEQCIQNYWKNNGGDSRGTEFPTIAKWNGQTVGAFKQAMALMTTDSGNTSNMDTQSSAIARKYGTNTYSQNLVGTVTATPQDCVVEPTTNTMSGCGTCYPPGSTKPQYTQNYRVKTEKKAGGNDCPPLTELKDCPIPMCDNVDCVGHWGDWSSCSATCGTGTQRRTYTVTRPREHNGTECPHGTGYEETRSCTGNDCSNACHYNAETVAQDCPTLCGVTGVKRYIKTRNNNLTNHSAWNMCDEAIVREEACQVIECPPPILPTTVPPCTVILYFDTDYRAAAVNPPLPHYIQLGPGQYVNLATFTYENHTYNIANKIKSVRVGSGVRLHAYSSTNASGTALGTISSDTSTVTATINSFTIRITGTNTQCIPSTGPIDSCSVRLYYDDYYGTRPGYPAYTTIGVGYHDRNIGNSFLLDPDGNTAANTKIINDSVRSIKIGSGVKVTYYEHPYLAGAPQGNSYTLTNDAPTLAAPETLSAIRVEHISATCAPPPDAGCSTRHLLGTVTLKEYKTGNPPSIEDGGFYIVGIQDGSSWADGNKHTIFRTYKNPDNSFTNLGSQLYTDAAPYGIPYDLPGHYADVQSKIDNNILPNIAPYGDTRWAANVRDDLYRNIGNAPGPFIRSKITSSNTSMTCYGGPTFCIILETPDGSSSVTFARVGKPRPDPQHSDSTVATGCYGFRIFNAERDKDEEGFNRNWIRANETLSNPDLNVRRWPLLPNTMAVTRGSPQIGGTYNIYYAIRASDIPEAQSRGYQVQT